MNRRFLLAGLMTLAILPATAARADFADDLATALRKDGYDSIEITRTFLGRTRIVATASWGTRELILNPRTGEILRDVFTDSQGNVVPVAGVQTSGQTSDDNDGGDNSGPGGGDDGDGDGEGDGDHSGSGGAGDDSDNSGGGDDDKSGHGG